MLQLLENFNLTTNTANNSDNFATFVDDFNEIDYLSQFEFI